jgi:hypothetical protein
LVSGADGVLDFSGAFFDELNDGTLVKIRDVNDGVFAVVVVGVEGVGGIFVVCLVSENDGLLSFENDGLLENKGVSGLAGGTEIFETDGFEQLLNTFFLSRVGVAGIDGKVVLALKLECLVTAGVVLNPEELVGFEEEEVEEEILLLVLLGSKIPLVLSALEKVDLLSIDGV